MMMGAQFLGTDAKNPEKNIKCIATESTAYSPSFSVSLQVPRSSIILAEDAEYCVATVVLFRRVADGFVASARSRGFQPKEVAPDPEAGGKAAAALDATRREAEAKRQALEQWCLTSYGEAFTGWVHITAVRLFVESVLRYGLPPEFLPVLMRPIEKHSSRLRRLMGEKFAAEGGDLYGGEGAGADEHPYVSFTLNIEEHQY
jgi:V-type H+-transporting ATPase subunit C